MRHRRQAGWRSSPLGGCGEDAGLSLAELLVAMTVSSVLLVVGGAMLNSSLREREVTDGKTTSQADARIAMELLTRDLRVAVPAPGSAAQSVFAFAAPRKIVFYSQSGGATPVVARITYEVDAASNCLRRTRTPYVGGAFSASGTTTRCVAPGPVNTEGQAIFALQRIRPNATTAPATIALPTAGYSLPADEDPLKYAAGVRITLWVRAQDRPAVAPTSVDQSITLVNQSNAIMNGKIT
jgi:prepilin-type N-terminal cleavage/methylation domain-containing protein